ncbi:MAG: hypothetical protein H7Y36_02615 [Armatimonadetes bacterium]|nr:hypothetical protein [Akkermansiaceae bacterium]
MNDKDHAVYQALERVKRFGATHAASFPTGSIATTEFARGSQIITEIGPVDFQPGTPASPATGARNHLFAEVWEDLKAISDTARTIAKKEPGFAADFALGEDTKREILATATEFLKHLESPATVAKFVAYLLPADFVTDLENDLAAIDGKAAERTDDRIEDVGETARIATLIKEARDLIGSLNTSVRNLFRRDPEILAEWRAASRIHRTGGGGPDQTPPPAPPIS